MILNRYFKQIHSCTFKALPECDGTSYYYDSRSRLFAEQDGNMKAEGRFLLHFYDRFGREALNVFSKATESAVKSAALRSYTAKRSGTVLNGPMAGYAIEGVLALTADELHSACYYDDYSFLTATNPMWPYTIRQGSFSSASNKIRGVLTGSKAGDCLTALHYDDAGRTIRIAYGSATTRPVSTTLIRYDYEGNAVEEQNTASAVLESSSRIVNQTVKRSYYSSGHLLTETVIQNGDSAKTSYRYDSGGRVSQQTYSKDIKRKLTYNANGWLTSWKLTSTLNPNLIFPGLSTIDVAEPDLIKDPIIMIKEYKLKSDTLHYGEAGTDYTVRYDGKISGRKSGSDMTAYSYDSHGRLTQARTVSPASRDYSATYSYDRNSNILSINRMGITDVVGTSNSYGIHNSVTLGYGSNSNRLSTISVSREGADYEGRTGLAPIGGTVTGFDYDANGNLTKDPSRDIVLIKYNHLNLPTDVYFGNGQRQTIEYYGNGVKKSVSYSQTTASIVGGNIPGDDQYSVTTKRIYAGPHIFSDKHLEYSAFAGGYFERGKGAYYYVQDWQGNNVGVVDSNGKMVESTTYYPYGEPTKEPAGQRFLYGGKEREHGGGRNSYDFSARNLIAPLGQWGVPDKLAEKYFAFSPYSYCGGDPINYIDPDGKWRVDVHLAKDRTINGFGTAIVYNRHNEELFRFTVRAEGVKGHDRMRTGADTPLGTYKIPRNAWIIPNSSTPKNKIEAYGQYPRLLMEGVSGEIIESGRSLIRMHGGRQEAYDEERDEWVPINNPQLKRTEGCLRAYDVDMRCFKAIIDEIETVDKEETPEFVNIIDDLDEYIKAKYEVEYRYK